jgi:hypothetical protein
VCENRGHENGIGVGFDSLKRRKHWNSVDTRTVESRVVVGEGGWTNTAPSQALEGVLSDQSRCACDDETIVVPRHAIERG